MDRYEYEEKHGEEVGRCNIHNIQVIDRSCDQCEDELRDFYKGENRGLTFGEAWAKAFTGDKFGKERWQCGECLEIRIDDARVESGMKCGVCTYGF